MDCGNTFPQWLPGGRGSVFTETTMQPQSSPMAPSSPVARRVPLAASDRTSQEPPLTMSSIKTSSLAGRTARRRTVSCNRLKADEYPS